MSTVAGGVYSLTKETSGEPTVTVYYDSRELELRTSQVRFDGSPLFVDNVYDNAGSLQRFLCHLKGVYLLYGIHINMMYTEGWSKLHMLRGEKKRMLIPEPV